MLSENTLDGAAADPVLDCEIPLTLASLEAGNESDDLVVGEAVAEAPDNRWRAVTVRMRDRLCVTGFAGLGAFAQVGG
jgi:hypothetical protein